MKIASLLTLRQYYITLRTSCIFFGSKRKYIIVLCTCSPDRQWCPQSIHTHRSKGCGSTQLKGCGSTQLKGCGSTRLKGFGSTQDIIDGPDCSLWTPPWCNAFQFKILWFRLVSVSVKSFGQFPNSVSVSEPEPIRWFRSYTRIGLTDLSNIKGKVDNKYN